MSKRSLVRLFVCLRTTFGLLLSLLNTSATCSRITKEGELMA